MGSREVMSMSRTFKPLMKTYRRSTLKLCRAYFRLAEGRHLNEEDRCPECGSFELFDEDRLWCPSCGWSDLAYDSYLNVGKLDY
jgi:ribosomal protein S27AE